MSIRIRFLDIDSTRECIVDVPDGTTLDAALRQLAPGGEALAHGIWGRVMPGDTVLRDGDRIERYAPLRADPKAARHRKVDRRNRPGGKF